MIKSKSEYRQYLERDRIALGRKRKRPLPWDKIWIYQRKLRRAEYFNNCFKTPLVKFIARLAWFNTKEYGERLGFSIPMNAFGPGLSIAHIGSIVVNGNAKIGCNCRIHEGVTIGATNGSRSAPCLGDNIFLGTGAKVIGDLTLSDDIAVGANAVVISSFNTPGITLGGVPAKIISNNNSHSNLNPSLFNNC